MEQKVDMIVMDYLLCFAFFVMCYLCLCKTFSFMLELISVIKNYINLKMKELTSFDCKECVICFDRITNRNKVVLKCGQYIILVV